MPRVADGERPRTRLRLVAVVVAFAVLFPAWQLARASRQSATWDEPMHLTAGYAALRVGDFRVDPSHPPLARMWAAVPLALTGRPIATDEIDGVPPGEWLPRGYTFARQFVSGSQVSRTIAEARAMALVWGVVLGLLLFAWTLEWQGPGVAILTLGLYMLEPNLAAHAALVTTDAAVTTTVFGSVYFLWRFTRSGRRRDMVACAGFAAVAAVTKFSAVLLVPIVGVLLVLAVARGRLRPAQAGTLLATLATATVAVIWAAYGFRYAPSPDPGWLFTPDAIGGTVRMPGLVEALGWADRYRLLPNAFAQGLVYSVSSARQLPAYLAGDVQSGGWWYYFPAAIALKTPLAMLVLAIAGAVLLVVRRTADRSATAAFVLVPIGIWLLAAALTGVNIGVRHVLPVYPFLVLAAAAAGAALAARPRVGQAVLAVALVTIMVEVGRSEPYPLSFFNTIAGGPANGFRYLADSNLGWGGGLPALKRWMDARGVGSINLAYFGSVDPADYGVRATYLPSSATFLTDRVARPVLPGYVAISGTSLDGVYLPAWWRRFYAGFRDRAPVAVVANSIRIYWVDHWPEASGDELPGESLQILAEGLLFGLGWPEHAIVHYQETLARSPRNPAAWNGLSLALARTGRRDEALDGFRRVLALAPGDPDVRRNIALLEQAASAAARD